MLPYKSATRKLSTMRWCFEPLLFTILSALDLTWEILIYLPQLHVWDWLSIGTEAEITEQLSGQVVWNTDVIFSV